MAVEVQEGYQRWPLSFEPQRLEPEAADSVGRAKTCAGLMCWEAQLGFVGKSEAQNLGLGVQGEGYGDVPPATCCAPRRGGTARRFTFPAKPTCRS